MALISPKKITKTVFSIASIKKASPNTIFALLWQKIWPIIKQVVIGLFTTSMELEIMSDQ